MPKKLASWFNIGLIFILISFGVQKGFKEFFVDQFFCGPKPRNYFSIGFLVALVFCSFFAIAKESFIGTLIFLIIEAVLGAYFIGSYWPGGVEGVTMFFKTLCTGIKNVCTSCCREQE